MDKLTKALRRLSDDDRAALKELIEQIESGNTGGIRIARVRNVAGLYKVRKGRLRLFLRKADDGYYAVALEGRQSHTYSISKNKRR